jgi:uncharacterized membrane-anchored protein
LGAALQDPSPATVLLLCLALVCIGLAVLAIRSWLRRHANVGAAESR